MPRSCKRVNDVRKREIYSERINILQEPVLATVEVAGPDWSKNFIQIVIQLVALSVKARVCRIHVILFLTYVFLISYRSAWHICAIRCKLPSL